MQLYKGLVILLISGITGVLQAAFVPPSTQQLKDAAANPALIGSLIVDATGTEAAAVIRQVIDLIGAENKPINEVKALVASAVKTAFASWTGGAPEALAAALGQTLAQAGAGSISPSIVSTIQQTIVSLDNASGGAAEANFSASYEANRPSDAPVNRSRTSKQDTRTMAPPIGLLYEGQSLP